MALHTKEELRQKQALPLDIKVKMTEQRIKEWVDYWGLDSVYVSFSGGKDSTVLLDIARNVFPNMKAMFIDTGLEYPEVRDFVKTFDNVDWIKPKLTFKETIKRHGYPFISKECSQKIHEAKTKPHGYTEKYFTPYELGGKKPQYNYSKYKFMINSPFDFGRGCCIVMKKTPGHDYTKKTGRHPITGQTCEESLLRETTWLKFGCNMFDNKTPKSNPMSFWLEQDILKYIKINNLPICSIYGDVVIDYEKENNIDGQLSLLHDRPLKTSKCDRTGCMFCGYGCHLEKSPNRFEMMKHTHPKQYEYIFRDWEKGGLGYKTVIDWLNENGNLNIKY